MFFYDTPDEDEEYEYKKPSFFDHFAAACQTFLIMAILIVGIGMVFA